ncbi:CRISPR-associated endonuclease Cas3'' [Streptomyces sp. NPDC055796]
MLWGKSRERAGGSTALLLGHLLDTAAVGELLWDGMLAPSTRSALDAVAGRPGRGRGLFAWLCGIHDVGKATPAHQRLWDEGAQAVRASGLAWVEAAAGAGARSQRRWRHDWAGGLMARELLVLAGWPAEQVDWVWPLVAGHHGAFPSLRDVQEPRTSRRRSRGSSVLCQRRHAGGCVDPAPCGGRPPPDGAGKPSEGWTPRLRGSSGTGIAVGVRPRLEPEPAGIVRRASVVWVWPSTGPCACGDRPDYGALGNVKDVWTPRLRGSSDCR